MLMVLPSCFQLKVIPMAFLKFLWTRLELFKMEVVVTENMSDPIIVIMFRSRVRLS